MMESRFVPDIDEIIGRMYGMATGLDNYSESNIAKELRLKAGRLKIISDSRESMSEYRDEIFYIQQYLEGIGYALHDNGYEMCAVAVKDFVDGLDKILDTI